MGDLDLSLIDRFAVPAAVYDLNGRFVHMNPEAERAAARTSADRRGGHFTDVVVPDARRNVMSHFARAVAGEPNEFESLFVDGNGAVRGVRAVYIPLREADAIVAVLMLAYDATVDELVPHTRIPERPLTKRQSEILGLIAAGRSTDEIAAELTRSGETVRNHVRGLLRVLNAHTRVEAIANARRLGLLSARPLSAPAKK